MQIAWDLPYKGPAEVTVATGDRLAFTWDTKKATVKNDVFEVAKAADFKNCLANNRTGKGLTKQLSNLTYTTPAFTIPGTKYITSSAGNRCASKQKLKVNIVSALAR